MGWNLAIFNIADESLDHTVFKMTFTELQDECRCANAAAFSYMIEVGDFSSGHVLASVAGDVSVFISCRVTLVCPIRRRSAIFGRS